MRRSLLLLLFFALNLAGAEESSQAFVLPESAQEKKARGLIVRYHKWPSLKKQKRLAKILKTSSLKRTKSIRSFKAQLFEWEKGGLKPSKKAEEACLSLKNLSYVRRCSPDHLLSPNSAGTEAGFNTECEDCKNEGFKEVAKTAEELLTLRTCGLLSDKRKLMDGNLSDYWAQELIGSDLLREELKKTAPPNKENWIAVFDTEFRDHNIGVKNLISDEGLHAVLPELGNRKIPFLETLLDSQRSGVKTDESYKSDLSLYETSYPGDYLFGFNKKRAPSYINNSRVWHESQDIYEVFQKLASSKVSKSIIVLSSGNYFPEVIDPVKNQSSKDFDAILVGSFSPYGLVSKFSQSGEELSILAPSDNWITSAGKSWENEQFGGTSGAAPLVTGSLAGFEWLSGYHPTAKEAKILLEKTALPTMQSHEKPRVNGAGLLNAYKLGEVAKRLKEKCQGKSTFCFKEEILKDENYHFPEDKSLKRDLRRVFPTCSKGENTESKLPASCEQKSELFKRLRKAVLLNPNKELLKNLSCIYKRAGFNQNAEALNNLAMALGTEKELRAALQSLLSRKEEDVSGDYLRLMLGMGGFEEEFNPSESIRGFKIASGVGEKGRLLLLEKGFASGDLELQKKALGLARDIGEKGLSLLEKGLDSGNQELQEEVFSLAISMGEKGLSLLEKAFDSSNPKLQKQALRSAGWIGEKGLPLLEKGFASGNQELQKRALYSARRLGEKGLPLLEKAFDSNWTLKGSALRSAGWIGEKGFPLLEKGFASGRLGLQKRALESASNMGEKGLSLLEKGFASGNQELQKIALYSASSMGKKGLSFLEKAFDSGGNLKLQRYALSLVRYEGEKRLPLLEKAFDSGNQELQEEALSLAFNTGEKGLSLLEKGFASGNQELQEEALYSAVLIGEKGLPLLEKVLPLLEKGFAIGHRTMQWKALKLAGSLGEKGLPLLEKGLDSGNLELQKRALDSAVLIGEKGLSVLKKGITSDDSKVRDYALEMYKQYGSEEIHSFRLIN